MDVSTVLGSLRRNWTDRHWYANAFNQVIPAYYFREIDDNDGTYVVDRDWDTLFILDGCRYDCFESIYREGFADAIGGTLETVTSRGSASTEFIDENYRGRDLDDTVYVTANPFVYDLPDDPFYHVDHVWANDWNDDLETVHPETMIEHALAAHERYPEKRLVVHFMQPHYPFVGDVRLEEDRGYVDAVSKSIGEETDDLTLVWERLRRGDVDEADVRRAYRDNLRIALEAVDDLTDRIDGRHVVTADHGNAFGERARPFPTRVYGHDDYLHIPALVEVPWLVVPAEARRTITRGETDADEATGPTASPTADGDAEESGNDADRPADETVADRLEALGYR